MYTNVKDDKLSVIGPEGNKITLDDLPDPNTTRWVARRKAEVVSAVKYGLLSLEDACKRYGITFEEFMSWQTLVDKHGLRGLRSTKTQQYRDK